MSENKYTCKLCGEIVLVSPRKRGLPKNVFCGDYCRKWYWRETNPKPVKAQSRAWDQELRRALKSANIKTYRPYSAAHAEEAWNKIVACVDPMTHKYTSPKEL